MQNLDNHMDELFQKAAEHYPLKTNPGNFEDLMPFIGGEAVVAPAKDLSKGKRKTSLLLLSFIIIGLTTASIYLLTKNSVTRSSNTKALVKENSNSPVENNSVAEITAGNTLPGTVTSIKENIPVQPAFIYQRNQLFSYTKGKTLVNIFSPLAETADDYTNGNDEPGDINGKENNARAEINKPRQLKNDMVITEAGKETIDTAGRKKKLTTNESETTAKDKTTNKSKNKPGWYYGIAAGAELNEVKGQAMTKAAPTGGVILGLQVNNKISFETGVQVTQKKYYSDGKYFKPKAGSMPANMSVNSLQSTCGLIEIPVAVKYNFSKKKNTLYGKAGVSSYIITKEANKYQAVVSGQQQELNSTYKTNRSYFASDVRISAGYQHTVGKKLNIRVEPFIQIPLKGIGVGNMPVTSAGLQLVLTRN